LKKKTAKEKDYNKFNGKTNQKRIIPAGSVFYMKNQQKLQVQGAYKKMGYNQIIGVKNV
jgi:hypothetical protein